MVLVYEINLYYEVDVMKKIVIGDSTKYLLKIENNLLVYEETVDTATGIVSYTLGDEVYLSDDFAQDIVPEEVNLTLIIPMYQMREFSGLSKIRITGKDETKIVKKVEPKPRFRPTKNRPPRPKPKQTETKATKVQSKTQDEIIWSEDDDPWS